MSNRKPLGIADALQHLNDAYDLICPKADQGDVWRMVSAMRAMPRHLDNDVWNAIDLLADHPLSSETPGVAQDIDFDVLVATARLIKRDQQQAVKAWDDEHYDALTGQRK